MRTSDSKCTGTLGVSREPLFVCVGHTGVWVCKWPFMAESMEAQPNDSRRSKTGRCLGTLTCKGDEETACWGRSVPGRRARAWSKGVSKGSPASHLLILAVPPNPGALLQGTRACLQGIHHGPVLKGEGGAIQHIRRTPAWCEVDWEVVLHFSPPAVWHFLNPRPQAVSRLTGLL